MYFFNDKNMKNCHLFLQKAIKVAKNNMGDVQFLEGAELEYLEGWQNYYVGLFLKVFFLIFLFKIFVLMNICH